MRTWILAVLLLAGPAIAISDDLENSFQKLKDAQAAGDFALIRKFAVETFALTRKEAAEPAPENPAQKEWWTKHLAYLRNIEVHTEYALYTAALKAPSAVTVDLIRTLEELNPKSQYLDAGYTVYLKALSQSGNGARIIPVAEQALKNFPDNEDLLLVLADAAIARKQYDRALTHAERAIVVMNRHPRPEWVSAAEWENRRSQALGRSRWIAGVAHSEKTQYGEADKDLRVALTLVGSNETMLASTLFHLGVANYQIGGTMLDKARVLEAAKFSDRAAAIKGPLSEQAWRNAHAMRAEAQKLR